MTANVSRRATQAVSCSICNITGRGAITSVALLPQRRLSSSSSSSTSTPEQTSPKNKREPRWAVTPPRAKAPFSLHLNSKRPPFHVNSDPAVLDEFYNRMLGEGGSKFLSEEVKWLAVTHKSFDQGRRGFNDRLALLGKRIVQLQVSLALAQSTGGSATSIAEDSYGRKPFAHPALDGLKNLSASTKALLTSKEKLAELAQKYEMQKVLRWGPRHPNDLASSGIELVLAHTLYAVVGAIALEKGGHVANKVARERILAQLGLNIL